MTDPQRLAAAIDPRILIERGDGEIPGYNDLIAASDALRSSATALDLGRAMTDGHIDRMIVEAWKVFSQKPMFMITQGDRDRFREFLATLTARQQEK